MKVTLRNSYNWQTVVVDPTEQSYNPEFVVELDTKKVLEIIKFQIEMEALQQELKPLYQAAEERAKIKAEELKAAKEAEELEQAGEELPTTV